MIDDETKTKLLDELEKTGIVYSACTKVGVAPKTFYRWKQDDPAFRKLANAAVAIGRKNIVDYAEHSLLSLVKDKDLNAVKYVLAHNSARYKPKYTKVILEHVKSVEPQVESNFLQSLTDLTRLVSTQKREERQKAEEQARITGIPLPPQIKRYCGDDDNEDGKAYDGPARVPRDDY
jgi:hypothetical protein